MYKSVNWEDNIVKLIDQTRLPDNFEIIDCKNYLELGEAIKALKVRGAPAIGIAASYGVALTAINSKTKNLVSFLSEIDKTVKYLKTTRPTAVNLFWALDRIWQKIETEAEKVASINDLKEIILSEARLIQSEDIIMCYTMGKHGNKLIPQKANILTHCNTGFLATGDYGTALGVINVAHEEGKEINVLVDETRPLLQGSRLTAWELMQKEIPCYLITDNMSGHFMKEGKVDLIIVGADRIASNGDTANKIGTYSLAVLANHHNIPFYIAAPTSTFDLDIESGNEIKIEQRDESEVRNAFGKNIAPKGVRTLNPAFDVTPANLITAIITEQGVLEKPNKEMILKLFNDIKNF